MIYIIGLCAKPSRNTESKAAEMESTESGDVMKTYDPYNKGVYKGIKVTRESTEIEVRYTTFFLLIQSSVILIYI